MGRGARAHAAVAGGLAVDAHARVPRLGRAPRRAPRRLGRRPRIGRWARRVEQRAVARCARGLGLGRAVLLHSLAELHKRAATSLALGVRGENENAIGLYRDVGFEVEREWRVSSRPAD
jgi:GNAT superfamily N-acetyltransferase